MCEQEGWERRAETDEPDHSTQGHTHTHGSVSGSGDSMDDDHIAIHAHQHHEEDAAIEAQQVQTSHSFAQEAPEGPISCRRIVGPEGQRNDEEQVRHGQLKQTQIGHGHGPPLVRQQHISHQSVSQEAHDEDQTVEGGEEDAAKLPNTGVVTLFSELTI